MTARYGEEPAHMVTAETDRLAAAAIFDFVLQNSHRSTGIT
jgi:hypothetical protein